MNYINETTNGLGTPLVDVVHETIKFFVRTPTGKKGPYASRAIAEGYILGQPLEVQTNCQITEELSNGSRILLG